MGSDASSPTNTKNQVELTHIWFSTSSDVMVYLKVFESVEKVIQIDFHTPTSNSDTESSTQTSSQKANSWTTRKLPKNFWDPSMLTMINTDSAIPKSSSKPVSLVS